jgi:cytoskeleton-associated protein 5
LLCEKSGVNNAILKTKVKALLKLTLSLYDQKKTIVLILKFGTNSKNLKSVAESLDEISTFVAKNGVECLTEKDLKHFAKLADNNDKGVREGALQVLGEVYKILDEDIWRLIGQVTVKAKGLLDGRFKKMKGGLGSSNNASMVGTSSRQTEITQSNLQKSLIP